MKKRTRLILLIFIVIVCVGVYNASRGKSGKSSNVAVKTENTEKEEKKEEKKEKKPDYELTDLKVEKDQFSTYVIGILKNNTSSNKSYVQITFTANDKDGNKVGTAFANVNNLEPGKTWKFKAVYFGSEKDVNIDTENPKVDGF